MAYFKINNVDYSKYVSELKIAEKANYNSQTNAAGNTVIEYINKKRNIEVSIIPLNADDLKTLMTANDGKKSFSVKISGAIYNASTNCAGSKSFTLDQIARSAELISAPNFSDEQNPTIKYNNPLGTKITSLQACITLGDNDIGPTIPYRDIPKDESKYTFNLTYADKENLYNNIINSDSAEITFYVKSVIGDTAYKSKLKRTVTIVNAEPQIEYFKIIDINTKSLALTNDAHKIIEGFNTIDIEVQPVVKKGATVKKIVVVCGDGKKITGNTGQMQNVTSADFTISVTDSRKKTAKVSISKTPVKYIPLTCDLIAKAKLQGEKAVIDFSIKGKFFNGNFGNLANSIVVVWRYKTTDESNYGNWHTVSNLSYETNSYSYSGSISNLDYTKIYQVQAYVSDSTERTGVFSKVITTSAKPVFDWGKDDFSFNVPVKISSPTKHHINGGYALDLNNGDIINCNSFVFADASDNDIEGLAFYRDGTNYDVLRAYNGNIVFTPNYPSNTKEYKMFYTAGDSINISNGAPFCGYITSGSTLIAFTIPIDKPVIASSADITGTILFRGIEGYVYPATKYYTNDNTFRMNLSSPHGFTKNVNIGKGYIYVSMQFTEKLLNSSNSKYANNSPISGCYQTSALKITFS